MEDIGLEFYRARVKGYLTEAVQYYMKQAERRRIDDIMEFCTAEDSTIPDEVFAVICKEYGMEVLETKRCPRQNCPCKQNGVRIKLKPINRQSRQ